MKLLSHHEALKKAKRLDAQANRLEKKREDPSKVAELKTLAAKLKEFHDKQRLLPFKQLE